jgi:3-oxoadipate enol-lactonase
VLIEERSVRSADGVSVGFRSAGTRGRPIVFVHGVGSTAAIWDYQLAPLSARFRCYAVELRGNGALPDPKPEAITRAGFVDDVLTAADDAAIERFDFVGCSLGGIVGFELWGRAPSRVRSFTFVSSFAAYPSAQQTVDAIVASVEAAGNMREFAKMRAARALPPDALPQRFTETVDQMSLRSIPSYIAATKATWTGDYRRELATITVPTLVVCGELDPIAPVALSEEIARGIPGAELVLIGGAGHVVNADKPQEFNAALERFLDQRMRSSPA